MNRIESDYAAFRAAIQIPRDKNWDDIGLIKPAEKKGAYVKVAKRKERDGGYHRKMRP